MKKIEVFQSNGPLFLEKNILKIKPITFYLRVNLKKYSIYNFNSKNDKRFKRKFLKFKFKIVLAVSTYVPKYVLSTKTYLVHD